MRQALLIPLINATTGKPHLFRSYDARQEEILLADAAMARASAPAYLPRHRVGAHFFANGGLVANGPALLAAHDTAATFGVPIARQRIVNVGTTREPPRTPTRAETTAWGL